MTCKSGVFLVAFWLIWFRSAFAVDIEDLDPGKEWRVREIKVSGQKLFTKNELLDEMLTKQRELYRPWAERPVFDPITFKSDLERVRRFYEARGYYSAEVNYELDVDEKDLLVTAEIVVREGAPVVVRDIDVSIAGDGSNVISPSWPELPLQRGDVFSEQRYQSGEQVLRTFVQRRGHAHVDVQRRAEVDPDTRQARISYEVRPGPLTVFGTTEVNGTRSVDRLLVLRELAYDPGEKFSPDKITESRAKILGLNLFSSVRIGPKKTVGEPQVVPMEVTVEEKPHREIKISLGYNTEEEFRAQMEWRHLNWLGGGRQLSVLTKYSSVILGGAVTFTQPHFLSPRTKAVMSLRHDQESEDTYLRNVTSFTPRLDHRFSSQLTGFLGFRVEYDQLHQVDRATEQALGTIRREGMLTGPSTGIVWNTADNPLVPKSGDVLSIKIEQAGSIWGGAYSFFKITVEAKKYVSLGWETIFASRLKIGVGDAIGADDRFPLFERYYAGGENSVRGYGRRRLGPLSASDKPLGGLSLIEGSLELRRPIWRALGGAVFIDFGQVSTRAFDIPVDDLKFSSGFGLSYTTPVGPLRLDVGFPWERPPHDRSWQIHFSVGAAF